MKSDDRLMTATHEASHAVMGRLLDVPLVGPVSIRRSEHALGFAFVGRPVRIPEGDFEAFALTPAPVWPAKVRRQIETRIMVLLAGQIGETFVLGPSSGYVDDA